MSSKGRWETPYAQAGGVIRSDSVLAVVAREVSAGDIPFDFERRDGA